jgi:hypothetical protein
MKKLYIGIATYKRPQKLERLLKSIFESTGENYNLETYTMCEETDKETELFLENHYISNTCIRSSNNKEYVISHWNRFYKEIVPLMNELDFTLTLVDDVELYPKCIENAIKCMETNYPDGDGIIGLSQECPGHPEYTWKPYGQIMVGRKFLERYKDVNYQFCCPNYSHFFQDEEMYNFSKGLNRFTLCDNAILKHYHPAFVKKEIDDTHYITRKGIFQEDRKIFNKRQLQGLIWGKTWELV